MSVVMKVQIQHHVPSSSPGKTFTAVLKLYDRRFGTTIRRRLDMEMPKYGPYPCTASTEAAYCNLIRKEEVGPFFHDYEEEERSRLLPQRTWSFLDGSLGGAAKYEAVTWHKYQKFFDRETRAYEKLSELQGTIIPRLFAHVRVSLPQENIAPGPADLLERPETRQYFEVKGILVELVDGYELSELQFSPAAPSDQGRWQDIVQAAVDGAHEINCRGVRVLDCSMYNVMMDKESHHPFIIDLAQCGFLEEMYEGGEDEEEGLSTADEAPDSDDKAFVDSDYYRGSESGDEGSQVDEWNLDPEIRYWNSVRSYGNPVAIGLLMAGRLKREMGVSINLEYPDYDAIIAAIRRQREQEGLSRDSEGNLRMKV